ncbi:MAG TPA: hypothetical protein VK797_22670 [Tepidisphaeraceae bacterium]|jgi:hypothetical protein|nr:hypothetical protein [Tepidisphaeraceae bacterium]
MSESGFGRRPSSVASGNSRARALTSRAAAQLGAEQFSDQKTDHEAHPRRKPYAPEDVFRVEGTGIRFVVPS